MMKVIFNPNTFLSQGRKVRKMFSLIFLFFFTVNLNGYAQNNLLVQGKIVDEAGQPINGASVSVEGNNTGVSTNDRGEFRINAPSNGTLVVTSVGYATKEVKVSGNQFLNIALTASAKGLEEVVVVGYGTQRKADVTGSVVRVDEKALREVPVANLTQALTGRAAGIDISRTSVRPGQGGQIRIRGNRSLTGSNDPLLVVDGIPYGGDINDLNPDDIASVDILKDASATAIYGSRGASGVILVTTKKGTRSGKPVLSINSYYGISEITDKYPMMNAAEFTQYRVDAAYSGGNTADEQAGIANGTNTDWQDLVYEKGHITNNEVSIAGGNSETQYGLSGGYYNETGVFDFISFERYTLRATIDQKIGKRIKVGLNTLNTLSYNNGSGINPMYNILRTAPMLSPYLADGTLNYKPAAGSVDEPFYTNPLLLKGNEDIMKDKTRRLRTFNSLYGEIEIIDGLKYRINVGLDFRQQYRGTYNGAGAFTNATSILDQRGTVNPLLNNASVTNGEAWSYLIENIISYEKVFSEKHRVNFTGLFSTQESESFNSDFNATGIPANYIQEYNYLQAGNVTVDVNNNNFLKQGLLSYMGRLNYTYDDRFLLTATVRRDGSSVLSPGNQWFTYPAIAVGWNISNEQFMSNAGFVSNLKLRLGWGTTSNQGIAPYSTLGGLSSNFYNYGSNNITGYYVSVLPNPKLKWESTTNTNVGLDFGLFNNRLTGSIDVYTQKTKDILVNKSLPISNGATSFVTNAAKTKGHGFELSLSSINVRSGDFSWATDFNFTINREEIVALEDPTKKQDIGNGWFVGQPLTVIYDFNKIGIWQTSEAAKAASYNSQPGRIKVEDLNNDGVINADDRMIVGDFQPDWIAGMTNRFAYKDFDLSVVTFAKWGNSVIATYYQSNAGGSGGYGFFGQGRANVFRYNYWTPDNPTNDFPQPDGNTNNADYYSTLGYRDGTFIKVRSINLGYALPSKVCSKIGINSLRVYLQAQNPFIVYSPLVRDGYGIDPEGTGIGNPAGTGTNNNNALPSEGGVAGAPSRAITIGINTPPTRSWILGVNLKL